MTDIAQLLQQGASKPSFFSFTSRYKDIPVAQMNGDNGEPFVFLRRRFLPQSDNFSVLQVHMVKDSDRLDNIANQYLGDPEKFWLLCDANNTLHPAELTETVGNEIKITLPASVPGYSNA